MEQLALISDIHGNLPALEAVLKDIKDRCINKIICLGDTIGKGPSNKETLDMCIQNCEIILKGNWEEYASKENPKESAIWVQNQIGKKRLEYIRNTKMNTEFWFSGKLLRLFHASPNNFNRVFSSGSIEQKKELFIDYNTGISSDIAGYADIHRPYMQTIENKLLFNIGSVGNSLDMPLASYVILKGKINDKKLSSHSIEFVRVPYDIEQAVKDAYKAYELEGMPELENYIEEITTCKYNRKK